MEHSNTDLRKIDDSCSAKGALRVSIVCYDSDPSHLERTLSTLGAACKPVLESGRIDSVSVLLVDNGPRTEQPKIRSIMEKLNGYMPPRMILVRIGEGTNLGFGRAHNLTFSPEECEYHLVLNPDVELAQDSILAAITFLDRYPKCGMLAPAAVDSDGNHLYLCKRYPTIADLLLRGFAPYFLQRAFTLRLHRYELRDLINNEVLWQPPLISGCFMLLRARLLHQLKGFDPDYFLYFEDYDLSLRAAKLASIAYVPAAKIIHHGGNASRKGVRHIFLFVRSALIFFNKHGWRWF